MAANRVLVFPRAIFDEEFSLLPWDSIQEKIAEIESSFSWLARHTAEQSKELVQAIPCAFIRNRNGRFCVLRRVQTPRKDLSKKLSLVVGGHIDNSRDHNTFQASMYSNLMRELEEEVGIGATENPLRPVVRSWTLPSLPNGGINSTRGRGCSSRNTFVLMLCNRNRGNFLSFKPTA